MNSTTRPSANVPFLTNVYACSDNATLEVSRAMCSENVLQAMWQNFVGKTPSDFVVRCYQIPKGMGYHNFESFIGGTSKTVRLNFGLWYMEQSCSVLSTDFSLANVRGRYIEHTCGLVTVSANHNNFLDYAPYTTCTMYLPFVGEVEIDPINVVGKEISVNYIIDILDGSATCVVQNNTDSLNIGYYQCQVGFDVPLNSVQPFNASHTAFTNLLAQPMAYTQGAYNGANSVTTHTVSEAKGSSALGLPLYPYIVMKWAQDCTIGSPNTVSGHQSNAEGTLSTFTGYIKTNSVKLGNISATEQEKNEIISLLQNGVYVSSWT